MPKALAALAGQALAVALGKKSNAADGRFGRALRGLQGFPISALASLDGTTSPPSESRLDLGKP